MTLEITHQRGDTFAQQVALTLSDVAVSIAGWTIASQLRTAAGVLVQQLTVGTRNDAGGTVQLTATAAQTAAWPLGELGWDVQFVDAAGNTRSTQRLTVRCVRDITRSA